MFVYYFTSWDGSSMVSSDTSKAVYAFYGWKYSRLAPSDSIMMVPPENWETD